MLNNQPQTASQPTRTEQQNTYLLNTRVYTKTEHERQNSQVFQEEMKLKLKRKKEVEQSRKKGTFP